MTKPAKKATKPKTAKKPGAAKSKGGRPSKYSEALVKTIAERLSLGNPLAVICRDEGMPHPSTVRDWMDADPKVSLAIARAREDGEDWLAAECLQIADTPLPGRVEKQELLGVLTRTDENGKDHQVALPDAELVTTEVRVEDMLGHRKLQIETRLKLLSKWNPKKYGDKMQLAGHDGGALPPAPQFIVAPIAPKSE